MVSYQHTVVIDAPPSRVFQIYANVAGWKDWDPEVEWSILDGVFTQGAKGQLKPRGGPVSDIHLVAWSSSMS